MDDRDKLLRELLLAVLGGYIATWLYVRVDLLAAWLTPRVSDALERLQARIRRRRDYVLPLEAAGFDRSVGSANLAVSKSLAPKTVKLTVHGLFKSPDPLFPAGPLIAPLPPRPQLPQLMAIVNSWY